VAADGAPSEVLRSAALAESYGVGLHVVNVEGSDVVVPVSATR